MSTHKVEHDIFDDKKGYRLEGELGREPQRLVANTDEVEDIVIDDKPEDEPEEAAPLFVAPSPNMPSPAEVEDHRVTHIP